MMTLQQTVEWGVSKLFREGRRTGDVFIMYKAPYRPPLKKIKQNKPCELYFDGTFLKNSMSFSFFLFSFFLIYLFLQNLTFKHHKNVLNVIFLLTVSLLFGTESYFTQEPGIWGGELF